jgi:hypothetical protein
MPTSDELDPPRLMVYEPRADGEWRHGMFLGGFRMEPTAADLVAYLQARPDLAVEVARGLRVLVHSGNSWWALGSFPPRVIATVARGIAKASRQRTALVTAGWALAGGSRG